MSTSIVKRAVTLRKRPGPQPPAPSRDELFCQLYIAALEGLCSQFEVKTFQGHKPLYADGDSELTRARQLARRAWNVARYATNMFEEDPPGYSNEEAEIEQFNLTVKAHRR
jgi:hypothetical protein